MRYLVKYTSGRAIVVDDEAGPAEFVDGDDPVEFVQPLPITRHGRRTVAAGYLCDLCGTGPADRWIGPDVHACADCGGGALVFDPDPVQVCSHCGEAINPAGYWVEQTEGHRVRRYHEDCALEYPADERSGEWVTR